jgi:hypothetical protein
MKGLPAVVLVGGVLSVVTALWPAESVFAWSPYAMLATGVLGLAAWVVASDHTWVAPAGSASHKKAA